VTILFQITKRNKMKTSVRNIIASLFIGTTVFTAAAEEITTGSVVNANSQEVISYTVHHATCANTSNGSIDIEAANGATNFYSWDNGMNAEDISGLAAGTYRLKIETSTGEVLFASFEVTAPAVLEGMITQDNLHTSANLDVFVQGGTAPYTYTWNTGASTEDLVGITTEGVYEVNVTDANGCQLNIGTYVAFEAASIEEENAQFELYPNPNNGNGTITWTNAEVERVNVVNAAGQVVNSIAVENTTSVTFDGLTAGVYVAQVVTADHTQTIKFIVQ
jgi:hypothetical protein